MEFLDKLPEYLLYGSAILGALVATARSLDAVVALTPSTKDDEILAKVQRVLQLLSDILLKFGTLNKKV
jgi:hypothetical protein